mmetsp:Transcript_33006/g.105147  ORF Transcript_33006/g.105147 Transcript_33006/m.105147 type:complete len:583 (+) Transcript_33006:106-1854(+)|eukprot:CAMPEP_0182887430 /NCGR_PEP_ID=MMETSP0034_2-20130328/20813_1 /TAXON_ID=156128 /ORGANISM="Nephroselmis pyriformis, Strain CCMP717" /LENGTH=582 /DNA_ID=CAMNT_0025020795 /DNA_START=1 /DNA_END=1749 /DNA_ORIENTATION=-
MSGYGLDAELHRSGDRGGVDSGGRARDSDRYGDEDRRRTERDADRGRESRAFDNADELRTVTNAPLPKNYRDYRHEEEDSRGYGLAAEVGKEGRRERDERGGSRDFEEDLRNRSRSGGESSRRGPGEQGQAVVRSSRGGAGGAGSVVGRVANRFASALYTDPHLYIKQLGVLGANARPSSLQLLVKKKKHVLSTLVAPKLGPDGLHFTDLPLDPSTRQLQPVNVPSFYLSLVAAKGVPGSGVQGREPFLRLARVALYNGAQYLSDLSVLSNIQVVGVKDCKQSDGLFHWAFDPSPAFTCLVRSHQAHELPKLKIVVELNVSYHLSEQEAAALPHHLRKRSAQVDEITVAWATITFKDAMEAAGSKKDFHVSLCVGPLSAPRRVADVVQQAVAHESVFGRMFRRDASPVLVCRISSLSPAEAQASAFLPPTIVCTPRFSPFITMYRKVLADRLLNFGSFMNTVAEPILKVFPKVLDDADMTYAFLALWQKQASTSGNPSTVQQSVEMFRYVCLQIWPLMHMGAVQPPSISNDALHQRARSKSIVQFVAKHPHETCTYTPQHWMHRPFDTSELAFRYKDTLISM